jgi:hypothetical protein
MEWWMIFLIGMAAGGMAAIAGWALAMLAKEQWDILDREQWEKSRNSKTKT